MQKIILTLILALVSVGAWGDFSCPEGSYAACLDTADKVCPGSARCVDQQATCFDEFPCDMDAGFVCATRYQDVLKNSKKVAEQYDQLVMENTDLREQRLENKNCVLNASSLEEAQKCVRQ